MKDTESCCPWYLTKTTLLLLSAYQRRDMWRRCTVHGEEKHTLYWSAIKAAPQQLILDPSVAVVRSIYSFLSIVFKLHPLHPMHTYQMNCLFMYIVNSKMFSACSSIHSAFGGGLRVCVLPESSVQARKHILEIHTRDWNPKMAEPFIDELAEKCVGKSASCTSNCPPSCLNKKFLKNSSWSVVLTLMFFVLHESSKTYN